MPDPTSRQEQPVVPPQAIEAEQAVLGAVLISGSCAGLDNLRPSHFYRESHAVIWAAMLDLHHERRGVDWLVLLDHLNRTGKLEAAGGRVAVELLAGAVPQLGNVGEYAAIVRRAAQWRRRRHAALEMLEAVACRSDQAYRDALARAS